MFSSICSTTDFGIKEARTASGLVVDCGGVEEE